MHPGGGGPGGVDQEDWRRARLESGNDDYCGQHGDHHKKQVWMFTNWAYINSFVYVYEVHFKSSNLNHLLKQITIIL